MVCYLHRQRQEFTAIQLGFSRNFKTSGASYLRSIALWTFLQSEDFSEIEGVNCPAGYGLRDLTLVFTGMIYGTVSFADPHDEKSWIFYTVCYLPQPRKQFTAIQPGFSRQFQDFWRLLSYSLREPWLGQDSTQAWSCVLSQLDRVLDFLQSEDFGEIEGVNCVHSFGYGLRDWTLVFTVSYMERLALLTPTTKSRVYSIRSSELNASLISPHILRSYHHISDPALYTYVGWVLSDSSAAVRLAAIKVLQIVYENADAKGYHCVDVGVRVTIMSVLGSVDGLVCSLKRILDCFGTMIYAKEPRIQTDVARFVSGAWEEFAASNPDRWRCRAYAQILRSCLKFGLDWWQRLLLFLSRGSWELLEAMFSGSYLYQVIGDLKYADRVERMSYNASPAMMTADMWGRQYLQQQNQVAAKNMTPNLFPEDGPYSNGFGLEPNYPCCTVNFPQGWPKFITNAFLKTADGKSLVHLYLGPFSTEVTLSDGNDVKVVVETLYPFGDTLTTTITATKDFDYFVRIPSWVSGGSISVGDGPKEELTPDEQTGLQKVEVKKGVTVLRLRLPAKTYVSFTEKRLHGSIAVHRGPLNYAFDMGRAEQVIKTDPRETHAIDLQYDPAEAWEYAIDPSSLVYHHDTPASGILPSPIFDSGLPPTRITASACLIDWPLAGDTFASSPLENPECVGPRRVIMLWPFGAIKLRISEFPVVSFREGVIEDVAASQVPLQL
ncbi:hypothetical protein D9758_018632 [Tetrapyrgos nigripes]|uniref:SCD domain-containing protein n=1 Tax=Tetrapyrgos nigripes TaxID=182062 RepID=A0A8H5B6X5_9AGAR|nr:hypothetical protein D9758_018632 [Tetrapyrgos nigripes]